MAELIERLQAALTDRYTIERELAAEGWGRARRHAPRFLPAPVAALPDHPTIPRSVTGFKVDWHDTERFRSN